MKPPARFYKPMTPDQRSAQEKFRELNAYVTERNGWIVSLHGDRALRIECLPFSALPEDMREMGYTVIANGEGERILASAITKKFTRTSSGALEPMTEGSTKPVASTITHAGITRVLRYSFTMA
jgi:hypothetical protein